MSILFHHENISFRLKEKRKLKKWIETAVVAYRKITGEVNYIFCSDEYLLELHQQYLQHNTYTDIITFDNSEKPEEIAGDIFISIERVKENAGKFSHSFEKELHRVMIHGILHLVRFNDKTETDKKKMRKEEERWLVLLDKLG